MAETPMINFKAYLTGSNVSEVRRFAVDASAVTNYDFMCQKLQVVFPILKNTSFKIFWKDEDCDKVTISTDEELITALMEMSSTMKMLYIVIDEESKNEEPVNVTIFADIGADQGVENNCPISNVICDVCEKSITGYRYKCMQCPDYDLCSDCEYKGNHSEHVMMRSTMNNFPMPKYAKRLMSHLNRSLRKSAGPSGHNRRSFGGHDKCPFKGGQPTAEAEKQEDAQETRHCGSSGAANVPRCPYSRTRCNNTSANANATEEPNLNTLYDLTSNLARQHLNPIVETLQNAVNNPIPNAAPGTLAELINRTMEMIGHTAASAASAATSAAAAAATTTGTDNAPTSNPTTDPAKGNTPETPMDTSVPKAQSGAEVTIADFLSRATETASQQPTTSKPITIEPDWTFIPPTNSNLYSTIVPNAENENVQPTAPQVAPQEVNIPAPREPVPSVPQHPNPAVAAGLRRLQEMGFTDNSGGWFTLLLERFNGNIGQTVDAIINNRVN